ncbi:hypothetical protein [Halosimplex pelagicum]|uniref:Uncharacterized protein n=1 Tax=Halosimplex pelagicum TaxID=869886 RepID=A0A7D5T6D7_9EURY|nr:hypothetical protein [Halosimplex pelagicum]QLH84111.1 hypothetical protein HZS54_21810 [Halosimplex pelagicum]
MTDFGPAETPEDRFWSALNVGVLALVAGAVSVALHRFTGSWPAEAGGVVAVVFAVAGVALVGYSAARRVRSGDPLVG